MYRHVCHQYGVNVIIISQLTAAETGAGGCWEGGLEQTAVQTHTANTLYLQANRSAEASDTIEEPNDKTFAQQQARSQANIPEGAKPLAKKPTRPGNNDSEVLYLKYRGCKTKRQRM